MFSELNPLDLARGDPAWEADPDTKSEQPTLSLTDRAPTDDELGSIFGLEFLGQPIGAALSDRSRSKRWKTIHGPRLGLVKLLATHKSGPKDGLMLMPGTLTAARRQAVNVATVSMLLLDLDAGQSLDDAHFRIQAAGYAAVMYTSHSNGKAQTTVRGAHVRQVTGIDAEALIGVDDVKVYLAQEGKFTAEAAATVEWVTPVEASPKEEYVVGHAPLAKFRVGLFLDRPFSPSDYPTRRAAQDMWASIVETVGRDLGLIFDKACRDITRSFYLPRHAEGAPFEVRCLGGRTVELDEILARATPLKPAVAAGRPKRQDRGSQSPKKVESRTVRSGSEVRKALGSFLRQGGDDFDVVGWLRDAGWEIRETYSAGKIAIRCPNEDAHSDPSDEADRGCVAMNPNETEINRAVITCRHAHCVDLRTADFLELMITQTEGDN